MSSRPPGAFATAPVVGGGGTAPGKARFVFLDGLRGVAAIVVMLRHLTLLYYPDALPQSTLSVDFFFMLSGFVLAYAYWEPLRDGIVTPARFMAMRFFRLYPMLLASLILAVTLRAALAWIENDWGYFAHAVPSMVSGFFVVPLLQVDPYAKEMAFPLVGPEWSLSMEFAINFLFALAIPYLNRKRLLACTALFVCLYVALVWHGFAMAGAEQGNFVYHIPRALFEFSAGCALWLLNGKRVIPLSSTVGLCIAVLLTLALSGPALPVAVRTAMVLFAFPAVIALGARVLVTGGMARLCTDLGKLSYPVYILHWPLLWIFCPVISIFAKGEPATILLIGGCGVAICYVSWLALLHVERPLRSLLESLSQRLANLRARTARHQPG